MTKRYYKYRETHRTVKGVKQKLCVKCGTWKAWNKSEFRKDRYRKDGLRIWCKECDRAHERACYRKGKKHVKELLRYEESHRTVRGVKQKLCSCCKQWKKGSLFHRNNSSKDRLCFHCKECDSKHARKRYERIRKAGRKNLRYEDRHRVVDGVKQKFCRKCKRWRSETGFYKDSWTKDGLNDRCKKCSYKPAHNTRKKRQNPT
ncbi:MAG: hypothetical protein CEE38_20600 [Planctomycetes bacterium B3_Pla]|nr:MAG: hypothetical protein CEE38_20600 [Planctomycetes bacterium B3_Pla]